jgi:hypothetical protein
MSEKTKEKLKEIKELNQYINKLNQLKSYKQINIKDKKKPELKDNKLTKEGFICDICKTTLKYIKNGQCITCEKNTYKNKNK